jgi:hypothetical protein
VPGRGGELVHGLVQGGGECELGLSQANRHEFLGHGDVVPAQPNDVVDLLAEHDDQDGGGAVSCASPATVDSSAVVGVEPAGSS